MVAANADRPDLGKARHHGIGIRPIADDVAEVPDRVHWAGGSEHGLKRPQVGMDVGDDKDAHGRSGYQR